MTLPTLEDISPTSLLNLDENAAYVHFYGLDLIKACSLISSNPNFYLDDLASMGPKAFAYYSRAVVNFLRESPCRENIDLVKQMVIVRAVFPSDEDDFLFSIDALSCCVQMLEEGGESLNSSSSRIDKEYRDAIASIYGCYKSP